MRRRSDLHLRRAVRGSGRSSFVDRHLLRKPPLVLGPYSNSVMPKIAVTQAYWRGADTVSLVANTIALFCLAFRILVSGRIPDSELIRLAIVVPVTTTGLLTALEGHLIRDGLPLLPASRMWVVPRLRRLGVLRRSAFTGLHSRPSHCLSHRYSRKAQQLKITLELVRRVARRCSQCGMDWQYRWVERDDQDREGTGYGRYGAGS